ncbi:hypothetical protein REPUB_Repub10bG0086400 [Reevesia pubescens]
MGGCATKPKFLKDDEEKVPVPVPPPEPTKEPVPAVPEAKEAADHHVVGAEGEKKVEADVVHEVVKAKDVDEAAKEVVNDQADKQRSLSSSFEENGAAEKDKTPSEPTKNESAEPVKQELLETVKEESTEPVKQEPVEPVEIESLEHVQIKSVEPVKQELSEPEKQAPSDAEKLKEANATMNQVTEKPSKPTEQTNKPVPMSVAPGKIESAQSIEAKPAPEAAAAAAVAVNVPETQNKETSADGKEGKTEVENLSMNSDVELSVR